ncbi:hypothetical protein [Streptomyces sp. V3I7]|uniref:hypothetical protein n=1 Tax=Streptomyces sp. V3I7 TaxID=3042278 RepID=UPI0027822959|nr:hypothetical protein [Streptomyces sp. V3I7]MDQ0994347.1 hypothetical protein [Streptomyces sp. V3I7]
MSKHDPQAHERPVPRDLPDQQAHEDRDDRWEPRPDDRRPPDHHGTGDVPDPDEAGAGPRGAPRQAGVDPQQPLPDEPSD